MKFLNSGFAPFLIGCTAVGFYYFLSPYRFHADNDSIHGVNIAFSLLFLLACCAVAFFYGKRKNKSGLIGLICLFAPYILTITVITIIPLQYLTAIMPRFILLPIFYTLFSYSALFLTASIPYGVIAFITVILLMVCSWSIGNRGYK